MPLGTEPFPGGILPPFIHPLGSEPSPCPELIPFPSGPGNSCWKAEPHSCLAILKDWERLPLPWVLPGQPQPLPRSLPSPALNPTLQLLLRAGKPIPASPPSPGRALGRGRQREGEAAPWCGNVAMGMERSQLWSS